MRRLHLFEFEDLPWLPNWMRQGIQDFLVTSHRVMGFYRHWSPSLAELIRETGQRRIVDLCSGAGGPTPLTARWLREQRQLDVQVELTDLFPNPSAIEDLERRPQAGVHYRRDPVDATRLPCDLRGVRTIVTGFHHLRPSLAQQVIDAAVNDGDPICVFEYTRRSMLGLLSAVTYPLVVLILTPLVRPLTWWRLVFTYFFPILPLLITWDGLVSNLRTYSPQELGRMTQRAPQRGYRWRTGVIRSISYPVGITYLIGVPPQTAAGKDTRAVAA